MLIAREYGTALCSWGRYFPGGHILHRDRTGMHKHYYDFLRRENQLVEFYQQVIEAQNVTQLV